jgi:uncharacterized protein YjiS (DUF1127 family)
MSHAKFALVILLQRTYVCCVSEDDPFHERNIKMFEVLKTRIATWKRYSRTVSELQSLSNRELADLGIARTDIGRIAKDAVR